MARMRLIGQCFEELKKNDENTAVTPHYIRQLALENKIRVVMVGRKRLIDYDSLISFLEAGEEKPAPDDSGKIRRLV